MDNPFAPDYREPDTDAFGLPPIPKPEPRKSSVVIHDVDQGSEDWHRCRLGLLTASEMKLIITPKLKVADNKEEKTHLYELLAQRVTNHVEPHFQSYDMERGHFDETAARAKYSEEYAPVVERGFITNSKWGFTIGYSPDGLVGDDGQIECKSRIQKHQMRTLIECVAEDTVPDDYIIQIQTGLLVSERKWCDFVSYSGGMVMATVRVWPNPTIQNAIIAAATAFERRLADAHRIYDNLIADETRRLVPTERILQL